jgi:hypothetical protein
MKGMIYKAKGGLGILLPKRTKQKTTKENR